MSSGLHEAPTGLSPRQQTLGVWRQRKNQALKHRKQFEATWMTSQHFASGKQWIAYAPLRHRVIVPEVPRGRSRQSADVLTRYVWTVIGELASTEFRPKFLFSHDDVESEDYADLINKALAYGWDQEWDGDNIIHELLLYLAIYGTGAIRCRFDKTVGPVIGRDIPHVNGKPILDRQQQYEHMDQMVMAGQQADLRTIREGKVVWEALTPWNLLPPPGVKNERDFPWEIIVRPVALDTLRKEYGAAAAELRADGIESMDTLGLNETPAAAPGDYGFSPSTRQGNLEDHTLLFTGYLRPTMDKPDGETAVFTDTALLDVYDGLPYPDNGGRPSSTGVTYFKYWPLPQRFWGRAFIEPGIGPQRTRNKRLTQMDEIIDRGLPKVYIEKGSLAKLPEGLPVEVIELEASKPQPKIDQGIAPGPWMEQDLRIQDENIEKALGVSLVSLGQNPVGQTTYSGLALLREADYKKLGPVATRLVLGLAKVSQDSIEAMRYWPPDKKLLIVGDEDALEVLEFDAQKIPSTYLAVPGESSAVPRSQAAEIAKLNDIWQARLTMGPPDRKWLDWYVDSLDASKALDLPDDSQNEQLHKAELENVVMSHALQPVPVADYDDPMVHVPKHREAEMEADQRAALGDQQAHAESQAIAVHIQAHLAQAQANQAGQAPQPQPPPPPPGAGPQAAPLPPQQPAPPAPGS